MKYSFTAEHGIGKDLEDALSRSQSEKLATRYISTEHDVRVHVCAIITNMPASNARLREIKREAGKNNNLQLLKTAMIQEWRKTK